MRNFYTFLGAFLIFAPLAVFAQEETANCVNGFCSLTNIQNVEFAGNAADLPNFLNSVYMICIGLAAAIGVLQIMRAGVTWMTAAGSHEKIGDAKNLIRDTIIGLLLVLAPTIVFSIINPDILKLEIRGLSELSPGERVAEDILWADDTSGYGKASTQCLQQGGLPIANCKPTDGGATAPIPDGGTCAGTLVTICMKREGATPAASCEEYKGKTVVKPQGNACDGGKGEIRITDSCCATNLNGGICCGLKTAPVSPQNPPQSKIPATGEPNTACKSIPHGTEIAWTDNTAIQCCNYQIGDGVSCSTAKTANGQKQYCSCSYDKK